MVDPNVVYLLLILSLWFVVTAAYVPGTLVIEGVAGLLTLGALYLLAQMPANWGALILIVVGVLGFLVVPFINQRLALLATGGLVLQAVGSLFLFDGLAVSPTIIAVTVGLALAYHRFVLLPVLAKHRAEAAVTEDDRLIGATGRVTRPLDPVGTVYVRGESWSARSRQPLEPDDEIVVVERQGLMLVVEGVKHKRDELEAIR